MGGYEDFLADEEFAEAFTAAYRGRHAPLDALWWLSHPLETGPSGARAPEAARSALQRAAFSRSGDAEAELALSSFERELVLDREQTLAAIAQAREPVSFLPEEWTSGPAAPPARKRRTVPIIVAVVVVVAILAAVQVVTRANRPDAAPAASPAPTTSHAATSTPTSGATYTIIPPPAYSGPASCVNLLDVDTVGMFGGKGLANVSARFTTALAKQPDAPVARFLADRGLVCAWANRASASDKPLALYAYAHISPELASVEKDTLAAAGLKKTKSRHVVYFGDRDGRYAFAGGFWSYSLRGEYDLLDEVLRNAPESSDSREGLQSAVYVTSEGLGDLRIGHTVPSSSALVSYVPNACNTDGRPYSGAWRPKAPFVDATHGYKTIFDVVTSTGNQNDPLGSILIYSPEIPTKSGIRVGDSERQLLATLPQLKRGSPYVLEGTDGKIAFDVGSNDPDHPNAMVVLAIYVVRIGDRVPSMGSDANGSCKA